MRVRTALNIDPKTIGQELQLVFGEKIPSNLIIEKWSTYYREKSVKMIGTRESSTEDIEDVCSLMNTDLHMNETETNTTMHSGISERFHSNIHE